MTKWQRYRKVDLVDVYFFEKPINPADPPFPIELWPCDCAALAQDGRVCGLHSRPPVYSYGVRGIDRWVWIRPGEYLIRFADGRYMTASPEDFGKRYEVSRQEPG